MSRGIEYLKKGYTIRGVAKLGGKEVSTEQRAKKAFADYLSTEKMHGKMVMTCQKADFSPRLSSIPTCPFGACLRIFLHLFLCLKRKM